MRNTRSRSEVDMEKRRNSSRVSEYSPLTQEDNELMNYKKARNYKEVDGEIMLVDEEFASNGERKLTLEKSNQSSIPFKQLSDNYDEAFALPGSSKQYVEDKVYQVIGDNFVEDNRKNIRINLLKKENADNNELSRAGKRQSVVQQKSIQWRSDEQDYEQLHQRILKLIEKEKKLYDEKEPDPLYWCIIGSDYAYFTDILIEAITKDLYYFSSTKTRGQDAGTIQSKLRIHKAHGLLLMLYDCYKLIHDKLREFQMRYTHSRFYSTHLRITNLGYEGKMKLIEKQIERLNNL